MFHHYIVDHILILDMNMKGTFKKEDLLNYLILNPVKDIKQIIIKNGEYEFAKIVILDYNIELVDAITYHKYGLSVNLDTGRDYESSIAFSNNRER